MSQADSYFQFPVAMLADATTTKALCQKIVKYSLVAYGIKLAEKMPADVIESIATEYKLQHPGVTINFLDAGQVQYAAAARRIGVQTQDTEASSTEGWDLFRAYGANGTQCRMRTDYLWTASTEDWLLMRFRVLCAVIAGIGDRDAAHVSTLRIRTLGAGLNSPKDASKKKPMLSEGAVKYWLEKLWFQSLFQHCKYGKYRWYSIRQPSDEFLAKVVKQKLERPNRKRIIDASL